MEARRATGWIQDVANAMLPIDHAQPFALRMEINLNRGLPQLPTQLPTLLLIVGGGSLFLGLMLIWNEWLLRWMVAGVFLLIGALLLVTGLRARRMLG